MYYMLGAQMGVKMDYKWNFIRNNEGANNGEPEDIQGCKRCTFASVRGIIVDMVPSRTGNGNSDSCFMFFTVEDENGNIVNFMVTPDTFVVDRKPLGVGMECVFWYMTDEPVPLIYPPQYRAAVAAQRRNDRMLDVSFYNDMLVNEEHTLQLNMDKSVALRTTNNQYFQGNPANHNLVVSYTTSTRSIPAQTTPQEVIVLCGQMTQE